MSKEEKPPIGYGSDLGGERLQLRWIFVDGPPLIFVNDGMVRQRPLWSLRAAAPFADGGEVGYKAHPLRSIAIDGLIPGVDAAAAEIAVARSTIPNERFKDGSTSPHPARPPRLLDLHLIAGATKEPFSPNLTQPDQLFLRVSRDSDKIEFKQEKQTNPASRWFWTTRLSTEDATYPVPVKADFARVVVEPRPVPILNQKGDFVDQVGATKDSPHDDSRYINVPRTRSVQGAIPITLGLAAAKKWLGKLEAKDTVLLTPDGIEIEAKAFFPGTVNSIGGGFLIAPTTRNDPDQGSLKRAAVDLILLPDHKATVANRADWLEAWRSVAGFVNDEGGKEPLGIEFRTRKASAPPAFRWPLYVEGIGENAQLVIPKGANEALTVDVPLEEMRVELRGSIAADKTPDGTAALRISRIRIANPEGVKAVAASLKADGWLPDATLPKGTQKIFVIAEAMPEVRGTGEPCWSVVDVSGNANGENPTATLTINRKKGLPLIHDERRLAENLRAAFGWETPPAPSMAVTDNPNLPMPDARRPLLSGFVPLADGWLQLPIPNLAPRDPASDADLLGQGDRPTQSMLDGFVRVADQPMSGTLSAYAQQGVSLGRTPSWSATITAARSVVAIAGVVALSRGARVVSSRTTLLDPELAFRGLLWFSVDAPGSLEALPRLSAGAGSFVDVEFRYHGASMPGRRVVAATIGGFHAEFKRDAIPERKAVDLALTFDPKSLSWIEGPAWWGDAKAAIAAARSVLLGEQRSSSAVEKLRAPVADCKLWLAESQAAAAFCESRKLEVQAEFDAAKLNVDAVEVRARANKREIRTVNQRIGHAHYAGDAGEVAALTRLLENLKVKKALLKDEAKREDALIRDVGIALAEAEAATKAAHAVVKARRRQHHAASLALLVETSTTTAPIRPWPSVAWLRPQIPLAAAMPMTRVAASAIPPLESRSLAPFRPTADPAGSEPMPIAALRWTAGEIFPTVGLATSFPKEVGTPPQFEVLAHDWPLGILSPDGGVPFVAFGVPGVELRPLDPAKSAWEGLRFSVRYDIPALDEAFATASLPPAVDVLPANERELPPERPVATALDWPLLAKFWRDQDRRRQISLVEDSYLAKAGTPTFAKETPGSGDWRNFETTSLIRAATWRPQFAFSVKLSGPVPYGVLHLKAPRRKLAGNDALLGLSLDQNEKLTLELKDGTTASLTRILGWSPASFERGGFERDNQGFGANAPIDGSTIFLRPVDSWEPAYADRKSLATAKAEFAVKASELDFWFRDVPLDKDGLYLNDANDIPFGAWLDPTGGFEWRLFQRGENGKEPPSFKRGRDRIPFFGFMLEPLRLAKLKIALKTDGSTEATAPEIVGIVARLTLADDDERPPMGNDLVRLELKRSGADLEITKLSPVGGGEMTFTFEASDNARRPISLSLKPSWKDGTLNVEGKKLSFPFCGLPVAFSNPTWKLDGTGVKITGAGEPIPNGAKGLFVNILSATVTIVEESKHRPRVELAFSTEIVVTPDGVAEAPIRITSNDTVKANFGFLDINLPAMFKEGHRAVTVVGSGPASTGRLLSIMSVDGAMVAAMFAARVDPGPGDPGNLLQLGCGRCEGELRNDPVRIRNVDTLFTPTFLRWEISKQDDHSDWSGAISLTGSLWGASAIAWPKVYSKPVAPGTPGNGTGSVQLPDGAYRHGAHYAFLDHRMEFGLFGRTGTIWRLTKPWRVHAAGEHWLSDGSGVPVEWSSVDSLAIGPAADLVPKLPTFVSGPNKHEAVTFVPQSRGYNDSNFHPDKDKMIQSGLGEMQSALGGTFGMDFRKGFWTGHGNWAGASETWTVVLGGFLGMQSPTAKNDEHRLVRLPLFLVLDKDTLTPGELTQTAIDPNVHIVEWPDTDAARKLAVRDRSAPVPASARQADIEVALRAGSLIRHDGNPPTGDIVPALLVEQWFRSKKAPTPAAVDWRKRPYWLASATMLHAAIEEWRNSKATRFRPISIVAGSVTWNGGKLRRGLASTVRGVDLSEDGIPGLPPAALISGGRELKVEAWRVPPSTDLGNASRNAQVVGLAQAVHPNPVFVVARTRSEGKLAYFAGEFPLPPAAEFPGRSVKSAQAEFADLGRGYAASPGPDPMRWLTPVGEGRIAPIRDFDSDGGSGLAGLGRRLDLPAQAGAGRTLNDDASQKIALARDLVWMTEKRVPVYLPLPIEGMQAPPLPWLRQSPSRARLPADKDVASFIGTAGLGDDARPSAQAFLPGDADALSVSERAGIITARRIFLLGAATQVDSFDENHSRFGRPAQAGASARSWMRTPRPGPLPPNKGDPARDRRPEASPLLPKAPLRFVVGVADTVRGDLTRLAPGKNVTGALWSATIVASPVSDSVVGEQWDATMRLRVELDVMLAEDTAASDLDAPVALLGRLLFEKRTNPPEELKASASVRAGDAVVPMEWLRADDHSPWWPMEDTGIRRALLAPRSNTRSRRWRSHVDLVLDPRPVPATASGSVSAPLAQAIAAGAAEVEFRLVVHPCSGAVETPELSKYVPLSKDGEPALSVGQERPPITLRWRLPAIANRRGGLPLAPSTMLFVDPAYEAGLAHPPVEDRVRLDIKEIDHPQNRGALWAVLSADRARVNRAASIAFMADIRFERPADPRAAPNTKGDGDLMKLDNIDTKFDLKMMIYPRDPLQASRKIYAGAGSAQSNISLAKVYQLSLGGLTESDGSPAHLEAGDVLQMAVEDPGVSKVSVWNSETGKASVAFDPSAQKRISLMIAFTLTDETVVEPPSALFAALSRSGEGVGRLDLPLYAQSPLPWRVDFRNLKRDFREGLVRRSATFVWNQSRPSKEYDLVDGKTNVGIHIVKVDRNGQMHLPDNEHEFQPADRMALLKIVGARVRNSRSAGNPPPGIRGKRNRRKR